jgi:hypothetical protein
MITVDTPDAWGYTLFCDDIRAEIGDKLTYVGTYSGRMLGDVFPFVLPRIALGIVYYQRCNKVILPIRYWIFLPGDAEEKPSIVEDYPQDKSRDAIKEGEALVARLGTDAAFTTSHSRLSLVDVTIRQPGLIRVRAVRGDELIRLGTLEIALAPDRATRPATSAKA